ncbi:MAG: hypothetical protein NTW96_20865 [Planctomycetia bacterium]|nr:hypothetical protein [Planctomycetia bacterium]
MRELPRHHAVWLIVGCCLVAAYSGCSWQRPRHGVIVRGDFALELNRIPWMTGRGEEHARADCGEAECTDSREPAAGAGEACATGGSKRSCPSGDGAVAAAAAATPVAAAGGCYNQPRFFPVPTRPVFSARADLSGPPTPPGVAQQPDGSPGTRGAMPIENRPPRGVPSGPSVPGPELVPTPPGEKPSPDKPAGPTTPSTSTLSLPKWLVTPPENAAKSSPPAQPTSRDGWALRR